MKLFRSAGVRAVLTVLAALAVLAMTRSVAGSSSGARNHPGSMIVWFSGGQTHGLRQDSRQALIASDRQLAVENPTAKLFAAAYWPDAGMLITVDETANTGLYQSDNGVLRLRQTRPPHQTTTGDRKPRPIKTRVVRFCRIPGLVYLTWSYPRPKTPIQVGTQFSERLALGPLARGWHAVTSDDPRVLFLDYTYRSVSRKMLHLFMPDGKMVKVRLPGELGQVASPPPYVEREPVFVLPGRAIICKTRSGWSLHKLSGSLIRYFSSAKLDSWYWTQPSYKNGQFYLCNVSNSDVHTYRMDIPSGKLVYVGENPPQ